MRFKIDLNDRHYSYSTTSHTSPGGQVYTWTYKPPGRKSSSRSTLFATSTIPVEFTVSREGFGARISKALGFASEFQTGDVEFDKSFYLLTDDSQLCNHLRGTTAREAIKTIFSHGVTSLENKKGEILLEMRKSSPEAPPFANDIADQLKILMGVLAGIVPRPSSSARRANIMIVGMVGLLIASIIGSIANPYFLAEYKTFFTKAIYWTILPALAGLLLIRNMFGGSSHGSKVFFTYLFLGVPALYLCAFLSFYWLNIHFDTSPPTTVTRTVIDKKTSKSSKGKRTYSIHMQHWHLENETYKLKVGSSVYDRTQIGDVIRMETHPGHLGVGWLERYEIVPR